MAPFVFVLFCVVVLFCFFSIKQNEIWNVWHSWKLKGKSWIKVVTVEVVAMVIIAI